MYWSNPARPPRPFEPGGVAAAGRPYLPVLDSGRAIRAENGVPCRGEVEALQGAGVQKAGGG